MLKKCLRCGNKFEWDSRINPTKKYCSKRCRKYAGEKRRIRKNKERNDIMGIIPPGAGSPLK